jgi:hypothetical protein
MTQQQPPAKSSIRYKDDQLYLIQPPGNWAEKSWKKKNPTPFEVGFPYDYYLKFSLSMIGIHLGRILQ